MGSGGSAAWLDEPQDAMRGGARFGGLAALGLVGVALGAIPFLALLALVELRWAPLGDLDQAVADGLNAWLAANPGWLRPITIASELGGGATASYVLTLAVVWLLVRRQPRLAAYVGVAGLGLAVLVPFTKAVIGRARPEVLVPLVELPTNASFPSGHAMTSLVTWGALAIVAWPMVRRRWLLVGAVVLVVVLVGFTRLALGVHFVSDVLAGWAIGAAWLAAATAAFLRWLRRRHDDYHCADDAVPYRCGRHLAPVREPVLAAGNRGWVLVAGWAVAIAAVLIGTGMLITGPLAGGALDQWEQRLVEQMVALRSAELTAAATGIGRLAGLTGIVAVAVGTAALALAYRGSWRPVVFVVLAVVGEVALYGTVSQVVGRERPDVPDLTTGLPVAAAYPSGHVAAATVTYGALSLLVIVYGRRWWRWLVLLVPASVVALTMLSRVYVAAHLPTDTVAGLLLGSVWLAVLAHYALGVPLRHTPEPWWRAVEATVVPSADGQPSRAASAVGRR